jgi:predicted transcriptional regulator
MLDKLDFPLTNGQISEFILDKGYTTYFTLQQAISEMVEAGFIREESTHNRTLYHLTEEGTNTIHYFKNNISPAIQEDVDSFLAEKRYDLKNEVSVKADYYQNRNLEYSVRCQIIENGAPMIDLTLTVPTEEEAATVANNWNQKNQEIYAQIMANLL